MDGFQTGDLVACFLTNTSVVEELLMWGIVLEVTDTLSDVRVLDNDGNEGWYPAKRWRKMPQTFKKKLTLEAH